MTEKEKEEKKKKRLHNCIQRLRRQERQVNHGWVRKLGKQRNVEGNEARQVLTCPPKRVSMMENNLKQNGQVNMNEVTHARAHTQYSYKNRLSRSVSSWALPPAL